MAFPPPIAEKLGCNSAYICNFPRCNTLTVGPTVSAKHLFKKIGEAAHMEGEKQTSAGYNQANQAMVQDISNGMCLCANCHKMIDKNNSDDFHLTELKKEGGA
ncbi:HNH endonuclease [Paraburkholderia bannensis]|uniref:HNH endonuclease n=1 Tax=Paraburkholderia bannensis TaxID=765414 RepID=UPI002AB5F125|nr:HNH endonuclease [Paraburkholderia bannensis]